MSTVLRPTRSRGSATTPPQSVSIKPSVRKAIHEALRGHRVALLHRQLCNLEELADADRLARDLRADLRYNCSVEARQRREHRLNVLGRLRHGNIHAHVEHSRQFRLVQEVRVRGRRYDEKPSAGLRRLFFQQREKRLEDDVGETHPDADIIYEPLEIVENHQRQLAFVRVLEYLGDRAHLCLLCETHVVLARDTAHERIVRAPR
mmetsp:Transcript_107685/g.303346  ORF Transcript_107685/g.303346 Transcript_107685/m.303346 type:complete len:205 (-) Transcript_107685:1744-2358(-)